MEAAVALGLPPREIDAIADSEPELLAELVRAAQEKWTNETELLAGIYELTHANYRVLLALGGAKGKDIPEPVRVPRPGGDRTPTKKKAATPQEFAGWIRRRNEEIEGG